jgi:hypothetical protein
MTLRIWPLHASHATTPRKTHPLLNGGEEGKVSGQTSENVRMRIKTNLCVKMSTMNKYAKCAWNEH